ncbi:26S proteasome non-ATPase regulatory subunit 2-like protein A [Diplonema papillatum]|nr:26S proteasome non-ATPase regulatory subunit 2-like protein A [Diplonema papillatum]
MAGGAEEEQAVSIPVPSKDPKKDKHKKDEDAKWKEKDMPGLGHVREEDLNDDDLKVKKDVDECVEKIMDPDQGVVNLALVTLTDLMRTSTGSVTSIPKPLKFCRQHFKTLEAHFEKLTPSDENTKKLADIMSLVSITMPSEANEAKTLKFKLKGHPTDLEAWGHEFVRFISHEIGIMWKQRQEDSETPDVSDLQSLVDVILPHYLRHNGEPAACDLLTECDQLSTVARYCTEDNHEKICAYLLAASYYLPHPENKDTLAITYTIYHQLKRYPSALIVAMKLNSMQKIESLMSECEDYTVKKQMAVMLARQRITLETGDETIDNLIWNTKLSEFYLHCAKDLDSMAPKSPDEVYKVHLQDQRTHMSADISSQQLNLASTFVNAFVNAGFESDKLLTPSSESGNEWMYKNKENKIISAAASLGLLYLWDVDEGLMKTDKYLYSQEDYIKAGTLMAMGILHCGVKNECDPAKALMDEYLQDKSRDLRLGAIVGLGFAYAGSRREELMESLIPIVVDAGESVEVQAFAALSLGMVYVGSCNEDVSEALIACLCDKDDKQAAAPMCRFIALAAGLLFLGSEEGADAAVESSVAMNPAIQPFAEAVIKICAYAGTGNVVQIQALLATIAESGSKESKDKEKEKEKKDDKKDDKKKDEDIGVTPEMVCAIGISLITIGEPLGTEMCKRMFDSVLQYGSGTCRRAVPLALALANVSSPLMQVIDTLSKLSHDPDKETSMSAILALGIVAAGTNNARVSSLLRNLASYYAKEASHLFLVRVAQGIVMLGKGHLTLNPLHSDRTLLSPVAIGGLLVVIFAALDMKHTILGNYHYMLFFLVTAMNPRMLLTVLPSVENERGVEEKAVSCRVGTFVDTVAQAGKPARITGFQTHETPVLLQQTDRAEIASEQYLPVTPVVEGIVLLKLNPDYKPPSQPKI